MRADDGLSGEEASSAEMVRLRRFRAGCCRCPSALGPRRSRCGHLRVTGLSRHVSLHGSSPIKEPALTGRLLSCPRGL